MKEIIERLRAILTNPFVGLSWRIALFVGVGGLGWIGALLSSIEDHSGNLELSLSDLRAAYASDSAAKDSRLSNMDRDLDVIQRAQSSLQSDMVSLKTDVARLTGLLQRSELMDGIAITGRSIPPIALTGP